MIKRKDDIKAQFKTNCVPTEADFADMIDSGINQMDDGLKKSPGDPLTIVAGGDTQEVFSFYKSFDAKKPAWNTNLNPAGVSPGLNFYTQNGSSRLFISEDTGNIGIGNVLPLKVEGEAGPILQLGTDGGGSSSGQLILSKVTNSGNRSFKIGLDDAFNFSLGDYDAFNSARKYTPALTIDWKEKNVTIPQALNVGGRLSAGGIDLKDNGLIILKDGGGDKADLGLYSTIKNHWIRIATNQAPIAFFNNKDGEHWSGKFPSLLIAANRNVGIGTDAILDTGTGPVLQIGSDVRGDSIGELILSRGNTGSRSFKMGLDADFNFSIGDFGTSVVSPRIYSPGLLINYNSRDVTIPKRLNVGNGLMLTGDGKIILRASADNTISVVNCADLGLYSTIEKNNMRFAVNQAAIAFYNNKSGEATGDGKISLLIDVNGNVGVGNGTFFEVLKSGTDPVLQIGTDEGGDNAGQLIISKHKTSDGSSRSFKMGYDSKFNFILGDYEYSGSARAYTPAISIDYVDKNVTVPQSLFVNGKVALGGGVNLKNCGAIRMAADTDADPTKIATDLGLYSSIKGRWIRIAANQAPIKFFNTKEGENECGVVSSMVIDTSRNVGVGVDSPNARLDVDGCIHTTGGRSITTFHKSQGTYITWNVENGLGETNFINNRNIARGGFRFVDIGKDDDIYAGTDDPTLDVGKKQELVAAKLKKHTVVNITGGNSPDGFQGGRVGIGLGTDLPSAMLHAQSSDVRVAAFLATNASGNGLKVDGNGTYATGHVFSPSDIRIKKDIVSCNSSINLDILRRLNIADYQHIDPATFNGKLVKGLIAQEVEAIFPEAIIVAKDFLPHILSAPKAISEANGLVTFIMTEPHELSNNDFVKFKTSTGSKEKTIILVNDNSFSVEGSVEEYQGEVIVYGKQVNDFRMIDYNRLFTLNLSATQQLAKENDELKAKSIALEAMLAGFEQRLSELVN